MITISNPKTVLIGPVTEILHSEICQYLVKLNKNFDINVLTLFDDYPISKHWYSNATLKGISGKNQFDIHMNSWMSKWASMKKDVELSICIEDDLTATEFQRLSQLVRSRNRISNGYVNAPLFDSMNSQAEKIE